MSSINATILPVFGIYKLSQGLSQAIFGISTRYPAMCSQGVEVRYLLAIFKTVCRYSIDDTKSPCRFNIFKIVCGVCKIAYVRIIIIIFFNVFLVDLIVFEYPAQPVANSV